MMKPLFWMLVYRPETCGLWSPADVENSNTGNFFSNREDAERWAEVLATRYRLDYLRGAKMVVGREYKAVPVMDHDGGVVQSHIKPIQLEDFCKIEVARKAKAGDKGQHESSDHEG